MAKGKKKSFKAIKGEPFNSWRTQVQRLEHVYGAVTIPLWKKYPHLKDPITTANNANVFTPKPRNGNIDPRVHPFRREIRNFQLPTDYQINCAKRLSTVPTNVTKKTNGEEDFSVIWIQTEESLTSLIENLQKRDHVFMDIEGHNVRSFRGITSLLQIFDEVYRTVYFVDTLELYHQMELLLPILTNPKVIKVMHGSHNDIRSFEKDFSLYIVGLMDTQMVFREYSKQFGNTGRFMHISNTENVSYKNLVNGFLPAANLEKSETFTDFRQRPLHPKQQKYAFLDVWYLPYIYFSMISELTSVQISAAVELSKTICESQRYAFPMTDLHRKFDESATIWQLRRLRHYIAVHEDYNPEFLCPPSVLITLRSGPKPHVEPVFFQYPMALQKALEGEDGIPEFETRYSDLNTPFPFNPTSRPWTPPSPSKMPDIPPPIWCHKHWKLTDHNKHNCPLSKEEVKAIRKKYFQDNPDKKKARNRMIHRNNRSTPEKRTKINKRNTESKIRNHSKGYFQRRDLFFQRKKEREEGIYKQIASRRFIRNSRLIHDKQVSRGIVLPTRIQQYHMLKRQQYRDKVGHLLSFENQFKLQLNITK